MNVLVAHVGFDMPINQRDLGESFDEWADVIVLFDDELGTCPKDELSPVISIVFKNWCIKKLAMPVLIAFFATRQHQEFVDGFPAVRFFENGSDLSELACVIEMRENFQVRTLENISARWRGRV